MSKINLFNGELEIDKDTNLFPLAENQPERLEIIIEYVKYASEIYYKYGIDIVRAQGDARHLAQMKTPKL